MELKKFMRGKDSVEGQFVRIYRADGVIIYDCAIKKSVVKLKNDGTIWVREGTEIPGVTPREGLTTPSYMHRLAHAIRKFNRKETDEKRTRNKRSPHHQRDDRGLDQEAREVQQQTVRTGASSRGNNQSSDGEGRSVRGEHPEPNTQSGLEASINWEASQNLADLVLNSRRTFFESEGELRPGSLDHWDGHNSININFTRWGGTQEQEGGD